MVLRSTKAELVAVALLACVISSGCSTEAPKPLTQLILVADTDIAGVTTVEFDFAQAGKATPPADDRRAPIEPGKPGYMTLVYKSGKIDAYIDVSATGLNESGERIVRRSARVKYVRDKSLTVPLHLLSSCVDRWKDCEAQDPPRTCTEEAGCADLTLDKLEEWRDLPTLSGGNNGGATNGSASGMDGSAGTGANGTDGSVSDGGGSTGGSTGSNAGNTTGGTTGDAGPRPDASVQLCSNAQVDILSDVNHCGGCDKPCPAASDPNLHQVPTCTGGVCGFRCDAPMWGNCRNPNDGCETDVSSNDAMCGQSCTPCKTNGQNREKCVNAVCVKQ